MSDKVEILRLTGKPVKGRDLDKKNQHGFDASALIEGAFQAIADGIRAAGDEPVFNMENPRECNPLPKEKFAVQFGYGRRYDEHPKHRLQDFRHDVIQHQKAKGGHTFCFDGSFFKSLDNFKYWRFGLNSPLADGVFLNENSPSDRWNMIKDEFNIPYNNWKQRGDIIVICTQPDLGYSMNLTKTRDCLYSWIPQIRSLSDKKIIIKPHPNTNRIAQHEIKEIISNYKDVEIIDDINRSLYDLLDNVYALITWNSTVAIDSIVYGVPTFTFNDLGFGYPISDHDLNNINNPVMLDREQTLYDMCYTTWSNEELATGKLWAKYKEYLNEH